MNHTIRAILTTLKMIIRVKGFFTKVLQTHVVTFKLVFSPFHPVDLGYVCIHIRFPLNAKATFSSSHVHFLGKWKIVLESVN